MSTPIGLNQVAMPAAASSTGSGSGATFPLSGYGLKGASLDPSNAFAISNLSNNQAFFQRVYFPTGPVTNLYVAVRDAGTWDGATNGSTIGVYTDAGVLIDTIATNNALWTANGWVGGALSLGASNLPAAGSFGYIAALQRGMTVAPAFPFMTAAADGNNPTWFDVGPAGSGQNHRRTFYMSALTALPGSFDPTSAGTVTTFTMLAAYN